MTMSVGDLLEILEGLEPDMEVRFASQPAWPFEWSIEKAEVIRPSEIDPEEIEDMKKELSRLQSEKSGSEEDLVSISELEESIQMLTSDEGDEVLYLVEGSQLGYLPTSVCQAVGWE